MSPLQAAGGGAVKKYLILLILPLLLGASPIDQMTDDMILPQEVMPHGWFWRDRSIIMNPVPVPGFTHMTAWGNIFEDAEGSQSENTRIQVRNFKVYLLHKAKWEEVQITDSIYAGQYPEAGGAEAQPARRTENTGGVSFKPITGYMIEIIPWTDRAFVSSDVAAVYVQFEARLVRESFWKPDDRNLAKFVACAGADWWKDCCTLYGDGTNNPLIGFGRFKAVTSQWQTFAFSTVTR